MILVLRKDKTLATKIDRSFCGRRVGVGDVEDEQMQRYEENWNTCEKCGPLEAQDSRNLFDHTFVSFETG